jgi:hypothetical protein
MTFYFGEGGLLQVLMYSKQHKWLKVKWMLFNRDVLET